VVAALLAASVLLVYSPALRNGFVGYDDPDYVTRNPHVQAGLSVAGLRWALTSVDAGNWHPLTWASHMLDVSLFGLAPAGHHAMSVGLHAANAVLLFALLYRGTGRLGPSAAVAALFAVHPLNVESVAWVAERKNVLSTLFGLLTIAAYAGYVRRPGKSRYALVVLLFALGLAAKPMLVTLPGLLLLIDLWPLDRYPATGLRALLREKATLLLVSVLSAAVTIAAQGHAAALVPVEGLPARLRLANAVVACIRYLGKLLWPTRLAAFYPHPADALSAATVVASVALLSAAALVAVRGWRRRPWLAVGGAWYLVALLPVIGLVQVGLQSMADRYMYLPMMGLLVVIAWTAIEAVPRSRGPRAALGAAVALVLAGLAAATWMQVHVWEDGVTLWTHALQVTDANFLAHDNLGVELDARGRSDEALEHYRETLRLRPGDRNGTRNAANALFAKGQRLYDAGQMKSALEAFREGLTLEPDSALAYAYTGGTLAALGRDEEAMAAFDAALRLRPDFDAVRADRDQAAARTEKTKGQRP
jgi:tetratricopeptide (TPR) repeat protein